MPPRLFIEAAWVEADGRRVRLPRDRTHYLRTVLRLRTGAPLTLFDGSGREYAAVLQGLDEPGPTADVVRVEDGRRAARGRVVLAAGLTKGSTLDLVVQKATDLGAVAIHPLLTRRAVPRPDEGGDARLARWRESGRGEGSVVALLGPEGGLRGRRSRGSAGGRLLLGGPRPTHPAGGDRSPCGPRDPDVRDRAMTGVAAGFESDPRLRRGERQGGAGGQARPAGWLNGAWGPPRMNDQ